MSAVQHARAALEIARRIDRDVRRVLEEVPARPQITPQHYRAAYTLAAAVDQFLLPNNRRGGGAHFRSRSGRTLIHFDQVLRAILEDDLAGPETGDGHEG